MSNKDFRSLLDRLKKEAGEHLKHTAMTGFPQKGCTVFTCPWLEWRAEYRTNDRVHPDGLFLMQDWGTEMQDINLDHAIKSIVSWMETNDRIDDPTAQKLLDTKKKWKTEIMKGNWVVSNAVWGVRKDQKKCGILSDRTHKHAFLIWLKLVMGLAHASPGKGFQLVVAGSWARFDGEPPKYNTLKEYLKRWIKWMDESQDKDLGDLVTEELRTQVDHCDGQVHFVNHPCTWSPKNLQDGPP